MELQKMETPGTCLPASLAMVLGIPVKSIMERLPNFYAKVFPDLREPHCWQGVHIQEIIRLMADFGGGLVPHELWPQTAHPNNRNDHVVIFDSEGRTSNEEIFTDVVMLHHGILTGKIARPGVGVIGHAVAFDHGWVYDPNGYEYLFDLPTCEANQFYPQCAWKAVSL